MPNAPRSNGSLRVGGERVLDALVLRPRDQAVRVEPGFDQRRAPDLRIVHLLRLLPHVVEDGLDVAASSTPSASAATAPRISWSVFTGKCGLKVKASSLWRATKRRVSSISYGELVLDVAERHHRRLVAGQLEEPAEQHGHVDEARARPRLDVGDHAVAQVRVRAAEVEQELDGLRHGLSPAFRPGTQVELERPGVPGLDVQHPELIRDVRGIEDPALVLARVDLRERRRG